MDGTPNMADLFGKMADMQQRVADTQAKLAEERVTAEAGGGMVTVVADGTGRVVSIKIEPAAVDPPSSGDPPGDGAPSSTEARAAPAPCATARGAVSQWRHGVA